MILVTSDLLRVSHVSSSSFAASRKLGTALLPCLSGGIRAVGVAAARTDRVIGHKTVVVAALLAVVAALLAVETFLALGNVRRRTMI